MLVKDQLPADKPSQMGVFSIRTGLATQERGGQAYQKEKKLHVNENHQKCFRRCYTGTLSMETALSLGYMLAEILL